MATISSQLLPVGRPNPSRILAPLIFVGSIALDGGVATAAERAHARLVYVREGEAQACATEPRFREAVAERLGYLALVGDAPRTILVALAGEPGSWAARVTVTDADGNVQGKRDVASTTHSCDDLTRTTAFVVALILDPDAGARPADGAPKTAASTPERRAEDPNSEPTPAAAPPAPPGEHRRFVPVAALEALLGAGAAPAPTVGAAMLVGLRNARFALDLDARFDLPASGSTDVVGIDARVWAAQAELSPCFVPRATFGACVLVTGGVLWAEASRGAQSRVDAAPHVGVGGRLFAEFPLGNGSWFARIHGDLATPVVRPRLAVGGKDVWQISPVLGAVGFGLGLRIF